MTKRCRRCEEEKPHTEFSPKQRSKRTGAVVALTANCRPCQNEINRSYWHRLPKDRRTARARQIHATTSANRELSERLRAHDLERKREGRRADPEKHREAGRRSWRKMMSDPARHAAYLETRRIGYRLRAEKEGREITRKVSVSMAREMEQVIPVGPLLEILDVHMLEQGYDNKSLARAAGVDDSSLSKIRSGKKDGIYKSVADALCVALDVPLKLVYPEL